MGKRCAVIIVTHNSERHLRICLKALRAQTVLPDQIILVDSGSQETVYLTEAAMDPLVQLVLCKTNVGFCVGNNLGYAEVDEATDYVLFLNPDAFLTDSFIEEATQILADPAYAQTGALSGLLLGYDLEQQKSTGLIDSSGIFSTWYGRFYDRAQGKALEDQSYAENESVPALCGALLFCRKKALDSALFAPNEVMDSSFYMYKEDIDLSLRLRKKEWTLLFCPKLRAFHCRGWQSDRAKVARQWRLLSAQNEMRLYWRLKSPCYLYSTFKFFCVKCFNI
jgi:N-acetylglucosaminyl-diphospho-decaprenol L-rhamnosyltransferase